MLVSGIFGKRNIYCIDAELVLPEEVFARKETLAEIRVRNRGRWIPAFLITIEARGKEYFFPYVPARQAVSGTVPVIFEERGVAEVGGMVVSSNFPFNFFTRFRGIRKDTGITVYPGPERCNLSHICETGARHKGEKDLNRPGYDSDILCIRDYVQGDPPKYINWKSTAKTGMLKVKELSAIERQQVIIDFDRLEKTNLEKTLSCTTYAVVSLFRSKIPVGLSIQGEVLTPDLSDAHRRKVLTRLALYGKS